LSALGVITNDDSDDVIDDVDRFLLLCFALFALFLLLLLIKEGVAADSSAAEIIGVDVESVTMRSNEEGVE
jgi:hypothetical protein